MRALLPMMVLAVACGGGSTEGMRAAINAAAKAVDVADASYAPIYEAAREEARASSDSWAERDAKIGPYDRAAQALERVHHLLLAVEASLDTSDAPRIRERAACAAEALGELRAALRGVNVTPSPLLSRADAALQALASACRGAE